MSFGQLITTELKTNNLLLNQFDENNSGRDIINETEFLNQNYEDRQKAIKNNMILVTVLNCLSICSNIFSVSFYRWYEVDPNVWLNMLYIYDQDGNDQTFNHYQDTCVGVDEIADSSGGTQNICINHLMILKWVGYVCFSLMMVSLFAQVYDLFRLRRILKNLNENLQKEISIIKGYMVYSFIILSKFLSLLIYFIATQIFDYSSIQFGCCYWLSLITCLMMCIFVGYYKQMKGRYERYMIMEILRQNCDDELDATYSRKIGLQDLDD